MNDVRPKDRLVVLHNLTRDNLAAAIRLGGLPVPSLGITKAVTPYTDFGEISLIGTCCMVNPRHMPVYACDAFTPSAPKNRGGCTLAGKTDQAVRRMISPAALRRRGLYGTGRLLADAAGCFNTMEAMQAARTSVVEASRAQADWNYVDELLNFFVLGVVHCHPSWACSPSARWETSALKALLTAYRHGRTRPELLRALTKRRFWLVPSSVVDVGMKILHSLSRILTPYFEAKPLRLVKLGEFVGAVMPTGLPQALPKALKTAGLTICFFDPKKGEAAQAKAVRTLAFRLAAGSSDLLYPVTTARILFKHHAATGVVKKRRKTKSSTRLPASSLPHPVGKRACHSSTAASTFPE